MGSPNPVSGLQSPIEVTKSRDKRGDESQLRRKLRDAICPAKRRGARRHCDVASRTPTSERLSDEIGIEFSACVSPRKILEIPSPPPPSSRPARDEKKLFRSLDPDLRLARARARAPRQKSNANARAAVATDRDCNCGESPSERYRGFSSRELRNTYRNVRRENEAGLIARSRVAASHRYGIDMWPNRRSRRSSIADYPFAGFSPSAKIQPD